ncbi:hypothetical protein P2H44_16010 [Albimonas sp. CAU 1670]|uniref:hypothetical protein n=1 Tax=Albimonas sp. CAU 1670 TaxID=3032599 RepID=UPI0023DC7519|nr:hypothetical protein [Albimonas sp. CAU 1670]MDF2234066.1 hypothetical protein [Albimonas sp. CAU 1670]
MDMTPARICEVLRDRLARDVAPALADDHARSQLFAAIDVLGKIAPLLEWSGEMLGEQLDALEPRLHEIAETAAGAEGAPALAAPCGDLRARLAARQAEASAWLDWLHGPGRALAPERRETIERLLREALQGMLAAERRRIAAVDFSSMTRG